jgi:hypothetical protein
MAVTVAFVIEAVLILAVVFSSIGVAPGVRGRRPVAKARMPAPSTMR